MTRYTPASSRLSHTPIVRATSARLPKLARQHVQHQDRLALGQPDGHQSMAQVIAAALRQRPALERAHDRSPAGVDDRQAHHRHGHQQHEDDVRGHLARPMSVMPLSVKPRYMLPSRP